MFKKISEKFLCLHKWKSHTKSTDFRSGISTEILICSVCGKITKITY